MKNPNYELVKITTHRHVRREQILCTSHDNIYLQQLKQDYRNGKDVKVEVRPQIVVSKRLD